MVKEGGEVELAGDLFRLLSSQSRPGVLCHHPAGLLESLPAGRVDLRLVLLVPEDGHDWRDTVVGGAVTPSEQVLGNIFRFLVANSHSSNSCRPSVSQSVRHSVGLTL